MLVAEVSEDVRARDGSRLSLVDSQGLNSPTVSIGGGSRTGAVKTGVTPLSLPQPISILSDSEQSSEATGQTNSNQPKLYGIILALVIGAYVFFR